jgi:putative NADPH-quinone reductase
MDVDHGCGIPLNGQTSANCVTSANRMAKRLVIIDGHPDPDPKRFCHALADAYAEGARGAGHDVRTVTVSKLDFPLLRSAGDWEGGTLPRTLGAAQEAIGWADHLVFIYPLWLGSLPAILKGFLEQVLRPGFAINFGASTLRPGLLKGKSARVVITMGMPALLYRWYFGAHSLKSFERNILRFVGIGPIRETLIGSVVSAGASHQKWLNRMRELGRDGL